MLDWYGLDVGFVWASPCPPYPSNIHMEPKSSCLLGLTLEPTLLIEYVKPDIVLLKDNLLTSDHTLTDYTLLGV